MTLYIRKNWVKYGNKEELAEDRIHDLIKRRIGGAQLVGAIYTKENSMKGRPEDFYKVEISIGEAEEANVNE